MFTRLATRSTARRAPLRAQLAPSCVAAARSYASAAAEAGGPSFELTEEQIGIRELTRNFTVSASEPRRLCEGDAVADGGAARERM